MIMNFMNWITNFTDEEKEKIKDDILYNKSIEIASVEMGYSTEEDVGDGYFEGKNPYYAHVKKVKGKFILFEDEQLWWENMIVFDDKQQALEELYELEDCLKLSIEKQIKNFKEKLGEQSKNITIIAHREYYSGRFYSFDIYCNRRLIIRNIPFFYGVGEKIKDKKYIKIIETMNYRGRTLHRIVALKDFDDVKAGDLGGWIESEKNLSQDGNCWIYDEAKAMDSSKVIEDAKMRDEAIMGGENILSKNATLAGHTLYIPANF